jgi:hypothetical protein
MSHLRYRDTFRPRYMRGRFVRRHATTLLAVLAIITAALAVAFRGV